MEVTGVALNGEMAYYTLDGPVLTLPLLNELDPGQSCRIYIRFSIDLTMGYGNGLDLICPLPLVAEDRDMLEEPGAPEYGAPAEYRVRLYGDTLLHHGDLLRAAGGFHRLHVRRGKGGKVRCEGETRVK